MVLKQVNLNRWEFLNFVHHFVLFLGWSPEISNEWCVLPFHHVQSLIQYLFSGNEHFVNINSWYFHTIALILVIKPVELNQLFSQRVFCLLQHIPSVFNWLLHSLHMVRNIILAWQFKPLSWERITDSVDSIADWVTCPIHNNIDRPLLSRFNCLINVIIFSENEWFSFGCSENELSKPFYVFLIDNTCNFA